MSALTTMTFFFWRSLRYLANLPTDVVLPAPCKPAIKITAGGCVLKSSGTLASPIAASSSDWTILTNTWPGVRLLLTSVPTARSFTLPINSFTTGKATSASSNAIRTSRNVDLILSSVRRPLPPMLRNVWVRRSLKFSNITAISSVVAKRANLYYGDSISENQQSFALRALGFN